jgi:hypothetical protein
MFGPKRVEGTAQANGVRTKKVMSFFSLINHQDMNTSGGVEV